MLQPPGPPGTTSCSAAGDVEAFDADLCASSGPDRKQVGALALGGLPVTRVSWSASSLVGRHAPAAAHEQTLGGQVLLCLIG
jgi:hypothetical protein